ncbi:MAG: prepilin-type N-terminal cleavage/methylation domain-containing protein [Planctomycetes bacterium]|nr:prepilin-type N-terminal cleavage/methylation domain-containing protein [Planctomycetota bacterium]
MRKRTATSCKAPHPRGFTLLEILLVLSILVIITSIAWPMLQNVYRERRLKQVVTEVSEELARTRNHAADTGLMYLFCFEKNGRRYIIIPAERDSDDVDAVGDDDAKKVYRPRFSRTLPKGFEFDVEPEEGSFNEEVSTITIPRETLADFPDAGKLAEANWVPIQFLPGGGSQQVMFIVKDDKQQFIRLSVRELTGGVSVSDVLAEKP